MQLIGLDTTIMVTIEHEMRGVLTTYTIPALRIITYKPVVQAELGQNCPVAAHVMGSALAEVRMFDACASKMPL